MDNNITVIDLEERLKKLTGHDFIECESIERAQGNMTPIISFSASFQLRIAAIALGTNPGDLQDLPIRSLNKILMSVNSFLLRNLEEEPIPLLNSGE